MDCFPGNTDKYSTAIYNAFISEFSYCTMQSVLVLAASCTVLYSTVQYCSVLYSTVLYSTVQYSTVQYSTVQ